MSSGWLDAVFLDAGGVLVEPGWDRVSATLGRQGVTVSAAALRTADPFARRDIDNSLVVGRTTDQSRGWEYFNRVLGHAGIPLSAATDAALAELHAYHQAENLWEDVIDGVEAALERLRALDLTLVVVSNANGRLVHAFNRLGLSRWFDYMLDSHEWGVEKPDPRLFQHALAAAGASADRTMHVGDLYHVDVVGARRAGLREAVLLDAAGLYPAADCPRVSRLEEVVEVLQASR
jgi:HAD superfamily hydrolase (TIGR01509 family)